MDMVYFARFNVSRQVYFSAKVKSFLVSDGKQQKSLVLFLADGIINVELHDSRL